MRKIAVDDDGSVNNRVCCGYFDRAFFHLAWAIRGCSHFFGQPASGTTVANGGALVDDGRGSRGVGELWTPQSLWCSVSLLFFGLIAPTVMDQAPIHFRPNGAN